MLKILNWGGTQIVAEILIEDALSDHRLSWSAKGYFAQLICDQLNKRTDTEHHYFGEGEILEEMVAELVEFGYLEAP